MSVDPFLSRWSRLKREARQSPQPPAAPAPAPADDADADGGVAPAAVADSQVPSPLPPVESLTPESDFTPFMRSDVDPATRRQALKTLFQDPQFNVMDGLDTYIADYSQPDPLPAGWLEKMTQVASLGDVFARREHEEKAAAEALAANPPAPPCVPPGEEAEPVDPLPSIEGMPTWKG